MKTTLQTTFRLTAVAAALLAAYGTAFAQQQPLSQTDPDLARLVSPSADDYVSLGGGVWTKSRPFQGQYDGMQDGGGYLLFDSRIRRRNDATGTWFSLDAHNLGLDTREIRLGIERQGDIGGYFDYDQIPHKNQWTINTNLLGIGQSNQTIQASPPGSDVHLGTKRDRSSFGFFKNLDGIVPGLKFVASYRNEDKTGQLPYGLGSQPLFLVQPIDSNIQLLDTHLEYSKDKLQLRAGYYATWYNTSVNQVTGTQIGGTTTYLSQPLNNQSWELYADGGYSFTPTTRGMFKVKFGHATMSEQLPSWDLTGGNAPNPNMPQSLDGKVDTTLYQGSISSRPTSKLALSASLRYYDMHDNTPTYLVVGPPGGGNGPVHSTPQSITTKTGKVEAAYRLPAGFKVIGTIDGKEQDRSAPVFVNEIYVPYRYNLNEWNYGIQLRRSLTETINGSLGYIYSKRTGSGYLQTESVESDEISPWNISDRNRQRIRAKVDWTPANNFALTAVAEGAKDQYPHDADRPYGMTKGSGSLYSLDATYQIAPDWQLVGYYAYDQNKADRYHARWCRQGTGGGVCQPPGTPPLLEGTYGATMKDRNDTLGLSVKGKINAKWKVGADVLYTKSRSTYDEGWDPTNVVGGVSARYPTSGGVTAQELPDIKTELARFGVYADYAVQKNASLRLDVIYEHWKTNDWTYTFADGNSFSYGTNGATADGTTFSQSSPQNSTFIGLRYKYMLD